MKSSAKNIQMTSYDELFNPGDANEAVQEIALAELHDFPNHPFRVQEDDAMRELAESIRIYGVLNPVLARPRAVGGYELISGHRRKYASAMAGKGTIPALVRQLSDDESVICLVDANIQREQLLPSEKAWAYKMKLEALNHQGVACGQVGHKSRDQIAENAPDSGRQIQRYIRLTELLPDFLQLIDDKKLSFNAGVEISYLAGKEQETLLEVMRRLEVMPSLSQAGQIRKYSQDDKLNESVIDAVLSSERSIPLKVTLKKDKLKKYFPGDYSSKQIEEVIFGLLETWRKETE